ncbi:YfiT family bacillithiol transferase [Paenibacillus soyae]|uniref:Putative metal-dependent hydrolase NQZ67_02600 n=1 Tax=Paenibacillus soyae TaxID=2969249 RepID=A0A9X2S779_9BACL|nr:bacillithiol transferase BstA [Paenibacillus soyae]MCR2802761.1 bacillithiol transferase BstA [Paenibacillus soyae]
MDLKYPIGTFEHIGDISLEQREAWIRDITELPSLMRQAVQGLTEEQLRIPYREGGWTIRQVVHHVADSHMNSYIRFKLALTEDNPTIRPYHEDRWAELPDTELEPIETSLQLLDSLHRRWVRLLAVMTDEQFARTFYHPGSQETMRLDMTVGSYSWHGRHHLAHITMLKERLNGF